jgi:hypothetical protein
MYCRLAAKSFQVCGCLKLKQGSREESYLMATQSQLTKIKAAISRLKNPEDLKAISNHADDVYCKRLSERNAKRGAEMFERLAVSTAIERNQEDNATWSLNPFGDESGVEEKQFAYVRQVHRGRKHIGIWASVEPDTPKRRWYWIDISHATDWMPTAVEDQEAATVSGNELEEVISS